MIKDVTVNITRQTQPLSSAGFGVPLILATNTNFSYKEYTSLSDVGSDFAVSTGAYKMANTIFSQSPRPEKIAIYGKAYTQTEMVRATMETNLTGDNNDLKFISKVAGAAGNYIQIKYTDPAATTASTTAAVTGLGTSDSPYVIDITLSYASGAVTATAADVKAAIEANAQANALVKVEYASGNDGTGLVTAMTATPLASGFDGSDASVLVAALNTLVQTKNDWFFLLCDLHGYNEIVALSDWCAAQKKMYFTVTDDDDLIDFEVISRENTVGIYHDNPGSYPDAAWVGVVAPKDPGSITFKFKTLSGIDPVSSITDSRIFELHSKNWNTYVSKLGVKQTSEGLTTSGEFADIIRDQYYVEAQIIEAVSLKLYNSDKIPYDNRGIAMVVAEIQNVLKSAFADGIIAADDNGVGMYSVTYPKRQDISTNDIANRILPDIDFTYTVGGAVHSVTVNGTITV